MNGAAPPKIAYVVKRYPRYSETFIVSEILAHEAAGWDVEIFSLCPPVDTHFQDALAQVRAPVHYLPSEGSKVANFWTGLVKAGQNLPDFWRHLESAQTEEARDVFQGIALAGEARQRGVGHLHAHFASVATTVTRLAARFAGLPYSFTAHAKDIFHASVEPEDLRRKLEDASAVVTVSDYNLQFLRRNFGPSATKVQRVYNGLDLERFQFEKRFECAPLVLGVGRLVEKKGFSDLMAACGILRQRDVAFRCQIIGGGELEASLRGQIEALDLSERVQLLGPRPQTEVIECLQRAAVLAAPCVVGADGNRDGMPTVLLEAMALGTPCVSTDVTGIPEVLRPEQTGLMVGQHDPDALAAAIQRLLADGNLRVQLALQARRLVEREFDIRKNAVTLRRLFLPQNEMGQGGR
jgi:glycosyltransferase involved in cell wall biosynthesis